MTHLVSGGPVQRSNLASFRLTQATASILGAVVCAALMTACGEATKSVAPGIVETTPVQSTAIGSIAGFVIDKSDECIIGARVIVVDGPQAGAAFVQTVCGFWDYGEDLGFSFHNLPVGMTVTLRATAAGYKTAEIRGLASNPYQYTTMITLVKEEK